MSIKVLNKGLPEKLFDKIVQANVNCNYHKHFDLYLTELGPGVAKMSLRIQDFHINPRNIAHGAVAYALLDTAMGMAIRTINRNVVTLQSSMNHISVAELGDDLFTEAKVVDYGKKIIVAESEVFNQKGILVAVSRGTFYDKGIFCEEVE